MLAIDPAMQSSHLPLAPEDDDDSDYEYEYHDTETETFFLNLDLTTNNGPIRPPRRRHDPSASASAPATSVNTVPASGAPLRAEDQDPAIAGSESDNVTAQRVQILGLHTQNPIISYQNQIFSGSWADQIGTELFFAHPDQSTQLDPELAPPEITPLKHTQDFDLIAANSVKILGRKANLISSSGSGTAQENQDGQQQEQHGDLSSSFPAPMKDTTGVIYKPEHQSNQARFLGRLMDLKKSKGETDTVRTVFSLRRAPNLEERLRGWAQTEEQLAVIQQLNDRALLGDSEAIMELENLYAQLGNQEDDLSNGASHPGG